MPQQQDDPTPPTTGLGLMEFDQSASWDRRELAKMARRVQELLDLQPWPEQVSVIRNRVKFTMDALELRDRAS